MARWWRRGAYFVFVTTFIAVALEILLRLSVSDPAYYWKYRFLYVSPNAYQNHGAGVWTYRPNVALREAAVYAVPSAFPPGSKFVLEYDCRMRSNNLGLLQGDDVSGEATVVVGDSFTAGQGGCPWFHRLQSRFDGQLVNAGLLGTGFEQWRRLLAHLQQRGVAIKQVLVIAISNDFKRAPWNWAEPDPACLRTNSCAPDPLTQLVAEAESAEQLIARTPARFAARFPDEGTFAVLQRLLQRHFYVYKFVNRGNETVKAMIRQARQGPDAVVAQNEAGLAGLKALGVPLHVLMLPQRNETGMFGQQADLRQALAILDAHGVSHSSCPLNAADFLVNDGHPTGAGYVKVVDCAHKALEQMKAQRPARD